MPNVFAGAWFGTELTAVGLWNFVNSIRPLPYGDLHHGDVVHNYLEPDLAVHPRSIDGGMN